MWKEKIVDCYRLRLGDQMDKFHMNLPKGQFKAVKQERLRREEQQRMQREADMEAETTGRSSAEEDGRPGELGTRSKQLCST